MSEVLEVLRSIRPDLQIGGDTELDGMLDSLDIVMLVASLEQKCGVRIDAEHIVPENFNSVEKIEALVKASSKA